MPNYYQPEQSQPGAAEEFQPRPRSADVRRFRALTWSDIIYIGFFLHVLYLGLSAPVRHQQLVALERDGTQANATITRRHSTFEKHIHYYLDAQFQANDRLMNDEVPVSQEEYGTADKGARILVTYLPSDPSVCRQGYVTKAMAEDDGYILDTALDLGFSLVIIVLYCQVMRVQR